MEQTLKIIEIISSAGVLAFIATLFWQVKSKGSMSCKVTQLVLAVALFALQIPILVLKISLHQTYGSTIWFLCALAFSIAGNSFLIGSEIGEDSAYIDITIKILSNIIERSQEYSEETIDNQ